MLQRLLITLGLFGLPALGSAQPKKAEGFVYESANQCKITFPAEPKGKDTNRPVPHLHKKVQIELKVTQVTVDGQTYRLGFSPHPDAPPQNNQKDQEYFDDFMFGFTERMKGAKLETNKKFEFGPKKMEARDFVVKGDAGVIKGRLIMRNKHLIVITVMAPASKYDEKKADAFIESFEFYLPQAPGKK
jgi:hypothetical protein